MKRASFMKPVRQLVTELAAPVCQRHGFVQASILLEWPEIVGAQFAQMCHPLKVTFPYQQRRQGQLHVLAPSGIAAELVYVEPLILERVNRYFGYQAITRLSIKQGPIIPKEAPKKMIKILPDERKKFLSSQVATIEDEDLRQALFNLGCGIESKQK